MGERTERERERQQEGGEEDLEGEGADRRGMTSEWFSVYTCPVPPVADEKEIAREMSR